MSAALDLRTVVEAPRTYPVRWEVTARRCAAPSCPREALASCRYCWACAPKSLGGAR